MKKVLLIVCLLMTATLAVEYIGKYEGEKVIKADGYTIKAQNTLDLLSFINNKYRIAMVPQILIKGESATLSPVLNDSTILNPQERFVFEVRAIKNEIEIKETIEIKSKSIDSIVTFTNRGQNAAKIDAIYNLKTSSPSRLFSPGAVDNATTNYVILADADYNGYALLIGSTVPFRIPPSNLEILNEWAYGSTIGALGPGQSFTFQYTYTPFYITNTTASLYPFDLTSHLGEPLVSTSGTVDTSAANADILPSKKPAEILKSIDSEKLGNPEFGDIHDVNLDGGFDSLGASMYAKELCIAYDIPCRLIIGERGSSHYAWLEMFTDHWIEVDPYKKLEVGPTGFTKIYEEPSVDVRLLSPEIETDRAFYNLGGSFYSFQVNTIIFYLFVLLLLSGVVYIVRKSALRIRTYTGGESETRELVSKTDIDGKYNMVNEEADSQLSSDIIKRIKDSGVVETAKLSQELGMSNELIRASILHMVDKGTIKKIGAPVIQEKPKQKITMKLFIDNLTEVIKEEIKTMTGPQKKALVVITAVAVILMILMFTLV